MDRRFFLLLPAGLLALRLERLVGPALPLRQELQTEAPFIGGAP